MSDNRAAQTPLPDLLDDIPDDARLIYEHSPTHHQSIPVGRLAREAAAAIHELEAERDNAREIAVHREGALQLRTRERDAAIARADHALTPECLGTLGPDGYIPNCRRFRAERDTLRAENERLTAENAKLREMVTLATSISTMTDEQLCELSKNARAALKETP